mmetsp:Transcript_59956/g.106676  ORF Transcript_59956/g.106676 Transcript_59956/m.106676 type:complete len:244 (-) Transcript_59956:2189-2920(-)
MATKDSALQERIACQTVVSMNASTSFSNGIESRHDLAVCAKHLPLGVDGNATHRVMDDRHHLTNVKDLVALNWPMSWEDLSAKLVFANHCRIVVCSEGRVELRFLDLEMCCKTIEAIHFCEEPLLGVKSHMPVSHCSSLAVENYGIGSHGRRASIAPTIFSSFQLRVHNRLSCAKLVCETLALVVEQQAAHSSQQLRCESFGLLLWLLRVHEACRVKLHFIQIYKLGSNSPSNLHTVSGCLRS